MTQLARIAALDWALGKLGTAETPPGSNRGLLIDQWNHDAGAPRGTRWCLSFVHAAFLNAGVTVGGHALVQSFVNWAQATGELVQRPFRGDVVCYDWNADDWYDHVGIVERVLTLRWRGKAFVGLIRTVEGNTGDAVRRRTRWVSRALFVRVPG
jgi:hypothetical protein